MAKNVLINLVLNTKISRAHPLGRNTKKLRLFTEQTDVRAIFLLVLFHNSIIIYFIKVFFSFFECSISFSWAFVILGIWFVSALYFARGHSCVKWLVPWVWIANKKMLQKEDSEMLYHRSCCVYPNLFPYLGITSACRGTIWKYLQKTHDRAHDTCHAMPCHVYLWWTPPYFLIHAFMYQHGVLNLGKVLMNYSIMHEKWTTPNKLVCS